MNFYSVDAYGTLINNPTDVFSVNFNNSVYYYSNYVANGVSVLIFSLTKAGNYSVFVNLYGLPVKNYNVAILVIGGDLSPLTTTVLDLNKTFNLGVFNTISISPQDSFGNSLNSSLGITMTLTLASVPLSPLAVSASSNWKTIYGPKVINYYDLYINFKVYIAGNYSVNFYVNQVFLTNFPITITFQALDIMVEHSSFLYSSTNVIAGGTFIVQIQAKDQYYNNITSLASIRGSFTSNNGNTGIISISFGVITASINLTVAGTNTLTLMINNILLQMPQVTVGANSIISFSSSLLSIITSSVSSGNLASFLIISKDQYGNTRYNPTDNYAVTITPVVTINIVNNQDGTYLITFTPYVAGTYAVNVFVNSANILGSPGAISVNPSSAVGLYSQFSSVFNVVAGTGVFNITTKDIGGNVITRPVRNPLMGNQYYVASFQGPFNFSTKAGYLDYSCFNINFSNIVIAGGYTAVLGLIEKNGLLGIYYKYKNFTGIYSIYSYFNQPNGLPSFYTQKDPQVYFQ